MFCALYRDRGSHFWLTSKVGGKVDYHRRTHVGRALHELGVQMIPAYSPQARGAATIWLLAFSAYNAYNICMQYTIRNIPDPLDEALRRAARQQGKSLNEVAIDALARGAGLAGERVRQRDLSDIAGTWRKDPAFDRALIAQDTIDEEMWP